MSITSRIVLGLLVLFVGIGSVNTDLTAKTADPSNESAETDPDEKTVDAPEPARRPGGVFESLENKVSSLQFYSTNYGILFLNIAAGRAGGLYPRGNARPYLFGGGVWFGGKKFVPEDPDNPEGPSRLREVSVISYNPNSGRSWMVPGEITDPYTESVREETAEAINKYRIYFSTDYDDITGEPFDQIDAQNGGPNWPIWDTDPDEELLRDRYLGRYVSDISRRNKETYPKGPAIISGEDIVSIFKDTDLSRYEISEARAEREGYPIGIEVDQRIYTWGFGQYSNFMFIRYSIVNKSADTLFECYMAPALDTDIGAAANDRTKIAIESADQDTLDVGIQWSETTGGDAGLGYMGADFLESPAVDARGFIRQDKKFYENSEQLGLHAFRNWVIAIDPRTPIDRYQFMAEDGIRDGDNGAGDKRFLMSTGPFNMRPNDTARVVVGIMIAPAKSAEPDGSWEDWDSLRTLDLFAQKVYDENFLAPRPPARANVTWRPLDNGVELSWDATSERSFDKAESGLDFLGYIIQRGRRPAGTDVDQYDSVVGFNIGFETIAQFQIPALPSPLARVVAARNENLALLGPWWRLPMLADTVPGEIAARIVPVDCFDTIKRQGGLPDTIIVRANACTDTLYGLTYDPYDDEDPTTNRFNDLSQYWWNDASWGDRFRDKTTREIVRDAIAEVADSVTNGRTFIDVGDDNGDGRVTSAPFDLEVNEKLINNIDYYYRVLAYDAGEPNGATPRKTNTGVAGINEVRATPEAPPASRIVEPEILSTEGLMGIDNFEVVVFDQNRLGQLFGGDTLDFEFRPFTAWDPAAGNFFFPLWYLTEVIVTSRKLGEVNRFVVDYNRNLADRANLLFRNVDTSFISRQDSIQFDSTFVRDGVSIDTTWFEYYYIDNRAAFAQYSNTFATEPGIPVFGTNGVTKSTLGVKFDYSAIFYGDSLRFGKFTPNEEELPERDQYLVGTALDPFEVTNAGGAEPNANITYTRVIYGTASSDANANRAIPSIGNALLSVDLQAGGTENLEWTKNGKTYRVNNVPYLVPSIRNVNSFQITDFTGESETLNYDYAFPPDGEIALKLDTADATVLTNTEATIRIVDKGEFAMLAYDWTDIASLSGSQRRSPISRAARTRAPSNTPIGTPNRYYVGEHTATIVEDGTTIDVRFIHRVIVNGAEFFLDFSGMGVHVASTASLPVSGNDLALAIPENPPTSDFEAGDNIRVHFAGGAVGMPQPGAKVTVTIPDPEISVDQYTDDILDVVGVVPNPYMIDHLGQATTGQKELYFTRLPKECTIEIYTAAGELVQTIEHSAPTPEGRIAVNAWDLVTSGNRQAETQLLVARITTPNGAETIKKFSIVVGGFRLLTN